MFLNVSLLSNQTLRSIIIKTILINCTLEVNESRIFPKMWLNLKKGAASRTRDAKKRRTITAWILMGWTVELGEIAGLPAGTKDFRQMEALTLTGIFAIIAAAICAIRRCERDKNGRRRPRLPPFSLLRRISCSGS